MSMAKGNRGGGGSSSVWSLLFVAICVLSQFSVPASGQGCGFDLSNIKATFPTTNLQCKSYALASNSPEFFIWALKDNATLVTSMVVAVPLTASNWAGIGFSSDGRMVGSAALIATLNATGGAIATVYDLNEQSSTGVVPGTRLSFVAGGSPVVYHDSSSKYVYMSYQVDLAKVTPPNPTFLLLAYGPQGSSGTLSRHINRVEFGAEFVTGAVAGESAVSKLSKRTKIHGSLNILGWGLLLPVGAMIARYARGFDPCWYYTHISFQIVGFACIIAGVATGVDIAKDLDLQPQQLDDHRGLGIFIFVLAILQILAVVWRPKKDAKVRKYWNWYHHWVGRLALFLAVVNIFVGLHMSKAERDFNVAYISILCIELGAFVILEVLLWLRWNRERPSQEPTLSEDPEFHFGGNI